MLCYLNIQPEGELIIETCLVTLGRPIIVRDKHAVNPKKLSKNWPYNSYNLAMKMVFVKCTNHTDLIAIKFHGEKNHVTWYWNLRNEMRCISEYLQEHYNTVYHKSSVLFKKCIWYFFNATASESNCNRSFRGQPAGWNRLIAVMCTTSTRVLP